MSLNRSKSYLPGLGWGGRSRKETVVIRCKITRAQTRFHHCPNNIYLGYRSDSQMCVYKINSPMASHRRRKKEAQSTECSMRRRRI